MGCDSTCVRGYANTVGVPLLRKWATVGPTQFEDDGAVRCQPKFSHPLVILAHQFVYRDQGRCRLVHSVSLPLRHDGRGANWTTSALSRSGPIRTERATLVSRCGYTLAAEQHARKAGRRCCSVHQPAGNRAVGPRAPQHSRLEQTCHGCGTVKACPISPSVTLPTIGRPCFRR